MIRNCVLLTVLSLSINIAVNAQTKTSWPHTLLWRISGNGLPAQSYLYGTMHLQDKRLFYFTDSLYHYLESAEGYAMEVDLHEMMDSIMQLALNEGAREERQRVKKADKKTIDSLLNNLRKTKDKASRKELKRIRDEKMNNVLKKEMPTIMDAYLYSIARRKGKWVGGIEDVEDQLSLVDELGKEISEDEMMNSEKTYRVSLEKMIAVYLAQDLDRLETMIHIGDDEMERKVFQNRNTKMALRMDSLSRIRSMFFTVGAAHLPGDSGVIRLLKEKGYSVEPVFSAVKVDPLQYAATLKDLPWTKVEDDAKSYAIEMPGAPSDMNMFNDLLKMKMYVDVATMQYYMVGSIPAHSEANPEAMLKSIEEKGQERITNIKKINKDGVKGIEGTMGEDSYFFRVQYLTKNNVLYMLLAGGDKKDMLQSKDVNHFFQSFVARAELPAPAKKQWQVMENEEKAFRITWPGQPKPAKKEEKEQNGIKSSTSYSYTEPDGSAHYMFQLNEMKPGYYLDGDSAYFTQVRQGLEEKGTQVSMVIDSFQGFPACRIEGKIGEDNVRFKMMVVNRGNRVHLVIVSALENSIDKPEIEKFLGSLELLPYKKTVWKQYKAPDGSFTVMAPGPVEMKAENKTADEEDADEQTTPYVSLDAASTTSYEVIKNKIDPYYSAENDSILREEMGAAYKQYADSVLSKKAVANGPLKGMEWLLQTRGSNLLKKYRRFISGDTIYTLISFIPKQYIGDKENDQFFESFLPANPVVNNQVFTNKAALLLKDLQSNDSVIYTKARRSLNIFVFKKKDLPLLQEALLAEYPADKNEVHYYDIRNEFVRKIRPLADSSTVDFIGKAYPQIKGNKEAYKMCLLDILSGYQTTHSYSLLKKLLVYQPPASKGKYELSAYRLSDSLELGQSLFPEILTLSSNVLFAEPLIDFFVTMLDSNRISPATMQPYLPNFLHTADTLHATLEQKTGEYGWQYTGVPKLLGYFNDAPANNMLQQYLLLEDNELKLVSLKALLRNGQKTDAKQTVILAADRVYRRQLYDMLEEQGRLDLFPSKYLTQRLMAESDLHFYGVDDTPITFSEFLEDRTVLYNGKKQRFFLFRISFDDEETPASEREYYLGVAGPYETNSKNMKTSNEVTTYYYGETFDKKKIDEQFRKLIED